MKSKNLAVLGLVCTSLMLIFGAALIVTASRVGADLAFFSPLSLLLAVSTAGAIALMLAWEHANGPTWYKYGVPDLVLASLLGCMSPVTFVALALGAELLEPGLSGQLTNFLYIAGAVFLAATALLVGFDVSEPQEA